MLEKMYRQRDRRGANSAQILSIFFHAKKRKEMDAERQEKKKIEKVLLCGKPTSNYCSLFTTRDPSI